MVNHLGAISKPSTHLPLLFFLITFLQQNHVSAQPPTSPTYFIEVCQPAFGNYTTNSTYETNLNHVLSRLHNHSSSSPFNTTSVGKGKNRVYGQYYCRGDIDAVLCHDCIDAAVQSIQNNCSLFKAAIMWYQECTLQYGNHSAVGVEAEYPRSWWHSDNNVSDTVNFGAVLDSTVDRIINESAYGNGSLHFATGEAAGNKTAYCLVQCSQDLNGTQCETCLRSAYGYVPNCCGEWAEWVFVFYPSCQLRYSTEAAFYELPPSLPPPVQPPPPPPSPVFKGGSATVKIEESMKLGLLGAAVAFLMFRETA